MTETASKNQDYCAPDGYLNLALFERDGHLILPPNFDDRARLWRGPRRPRQPIGPMGMTRSGGDSFDELQSRLVSMAKEEWRIERIRNCVRAIYIGLNQCWENSRPPADGNQNNSVSMKIRHFHNEFALSVKEHSVGGVYRSEMAIDVAANGGLTRTAIHDEHTVPVRVLSRMMYHYMRDATLWEMAKFLLSESVVTVVTESEEAILTGSRHPDYDVNTKDGINLARPGRDSARPFLRYAGKGIRIFSWLGETPLEVDVQAFTMRDHRRLISRFDLFNPDRYFPRPEAVVSRLESAA